MWVGCRFFSRFSGGLLDARLLRIVLELSLDLRLLLNLHLSSLSLYVLYFLFLSYNDLSTRLTPTPLKVSHSEP